MIKWIIIISIGLFIYGGGLSSFVVLAEDGSTSIVIDQEKVKQSVINGYDQGFDMISGGM